MMRKIILFVSVILIVAVIYNLAMNMNANKKAVKDDMDPDLLQSEGINTPMIGGKFSLVDHNGNDITNQDYLNKYMLIYFGFTNCPDVCTDRMNVISDAMNKLPDQKKLQVQPIFITLDPERDDVVVLKQYLADYHPQFIGLTGTNEQIESVKELYKVYSEKVDNSTQNYNINHMPIIYLMDREGKFISHFDGQATADNIAKDLENIVR